MRHTLTLLATTALLSSATAQGAGDELFDNSQVINMEFVFPMEDHWMQLVMNKNLGNDISLPAQLTITDATGVLVLDSVGVRLKGNSSYDFYPTEKKPMKIDFNYFVDGQEYHGLKKLNLNNAWSDPTMMRERIFMDVCRREGVLAPRMSYANVYLNGIHWGFYALVEQVDKTFLDRWLNDNDGNLFKAGDNYTPDGGGLGLEADLNHYGPLASNYTGRYELKTNETQNDWTDLIELLDLIDNATASEMTAQLPQRTELPALLRSLALDNLFGNMDAYYGSSRNYYLYHDSTTLKWNWIHWDANMSFGRYVPQWVNDVTTLNATYTSPGRRLLQRVMSNIQLRDLYLNEYCAVFEHFTNAELDPYIEEVRELIQPHVTADMNKEFDTFYFGENIEHFVSAQSGGFWQNIPGLKSFIAERRAHLLSSSLDCTTAAIGEDSRPVLAAFPNPTTGLLYLTLPTGSTPDEVSVIDVLGRTVPVQAEWSHVDLGGLPAGSYVVRLALKDGEARAHVVKQ